MGWKTIRSFLIGFGIRFPYLIFSIIISFLIINIKTEDKIFKTILRALEVTVYSVSFYVCIWVFWNSQDYPIKTYWFGILIFSILASILCIKYIRYDELKLLETKKLKANLRKVFYFLYDKTEDNEWIKEEKKKEHTLERIKLTEEIHEV